MTDPQSPTLTEATEHLWLGSVRRHPEGEVRLYVGDRLVSGTAAYQLTASVDEVAAAHHAQATQQGRDEVAAEVQSALHETHGAKGAIVRMAVNQALAAAGFLRRDPDAGLREVIERHRPTWQKRCEECRMQVPAVGCPTFALLTGAVRSTFAADTPTPADEPERRGGGA